MTTKEKFLMFGFTGFAHLDKKKKGRKAENYFLFQIS